MSPRASVPAAETASERSLEPPSKVLEGRDHNGGRISRGQRWAGLIVGADSRITEMSFSPYLFFPYHHFKVETHNRNIRLGWIAASWTGRRSWRGDAGWIRAHGSGSSSSARSRSTVSTSASRTTTSASSACSSSGRCIVAVARHASAAACVAGCVCIQSPSLCSGHCADTEAS